MEIINVENSITEDIFSLLKLNVNDDAQLKIKGVINKLPIASDDHHHFHECQ